MDPESRAPRSMSSSCSASPISQWGTVCSSPAPVRERRRPARATSGASRRCRRRSPRSGPPAPGCSGGRAGPGAPSPIPPRPPQPRLAVRRRRGGSRRAAPRPGPRRPTSWPPDGTAEHLDLGPQRFGEGKVGPVSHVRPQQGVHLGRLDATAAQRRLDPVGIFAERADIDHACSK